MVCSSVIRVAVRGYIVIHTKYATQKRGYKLVCNVSVRVILNLNDDCKHENWFHKKQKRRKTLKPSSYPVVIVLLVQL